MPLTAFQKEVARLLAANLNPDSHFAGRAVLNTGEAGLRFSDGLDISRDAAASVAACAEIDERTLAKAGYTVAWTTRAEGFFRAEGQREADDLRLEWTTDSAYRFFPVQADQEFGYCRHRADLATNKVLALAGRSEVRDFLDILQLDEDYLGLGPLIWAACGKDQGYSPALLLQLTDRHSRYQESDLHREHLARSVDLKELKGRWLGARAQALCNRLPPEELGCLYLDSRGEPINPDPDAPDFPSVTRHFGSVHGAWPRFS
jgi:hypothetical protein